MRATFAAISLSLLASIASAEDVWRFSIDGVEYTVPKSFDCETAIAAAQRTHAKSTPVASSQAPKPQDIRGFRGIMLTVGPDNTTGMVTASTRGEPVPMLAVYHDGRNAIRWTPVEVKQLPTTQRVTPAEMYVRTQPASGTNTTAMPLCKSGD